MSGTPTSGEERACPDCGEPIPAGEPICPSCRPTRPYDEGVEGSPYTGPKEVAGYRIIRELGRGGMGTVYEAFDKKLRRRVALKVLARRLSGEEKAHQRFEREAWIAGRLSHPGLVKVFDRGIWMDVDFYSMEFVDGGSLFDVVLNMKKWGRDEAWGLKFGTREYISWVLAQVAASARALDYAHGQGVIHRDVKPMNILLTKDPCTVKIADFGVALDLEATRMTTTQAQLGTVAYMAPEQIQAGPEKIDHRCDIFSLGVTLFELLTLELPYTGATQQIYLNSVLTGAARRPSRLNDRVSRDLDIVLGKALEKDAKDRYQSAAALAEDLENILEFKPIAASPPSRSTRLFKWARRKPIHAALAGVLILGVPTVTVLSVRSFQQEKRLEAVEVTSLLADGLSDWRNGRYLASLRPLSDLLEMRPDHEEALTARALSHWKLAIAESSPEERDTRFALALADASRLTELHGELSWPYRLRAYLLESMGREEEAAADEAMADSHRTDKPSVRDLQLDGLLAIESGDYSTAIDVLSEYIARKPGMVEARFDRARSYEEIGAIAEARVDYEVLAGLIPNDPEPLHELGRLMTLQGELKDGAKRYQRALELDPDNAMVHVSIADNLRRISLEKSAAGDGSGALADLKEVERHARRALELDPDLPLAHLNLGVSLMDQDALLEEPDPTLLQQATDSYERVIALWRADGADPRAEYYPVVMVNQCDALIVTQQFHRALEICRAAVDAGPDNPNNYYNLAGVYALLGRTGDSLQALERDFELGDRDWEYLEGDDWFVSLREDPRYQALIERMKTEPAGD